MVKRYVVFQGVLAFEYFTNTKADNSVKTMRKGPKGE